MGVRTHWRGIALGTYAIVGLFSFGHASARSQNVEDARTTECRVQRAELAYTCDPVTPRPAIAGFAAAIAWPLYWAWELQAKSAATKLVEA